MVWLETLFRSCVRLGASSTATLDLTVKSYKGPGYVTLRNIHSSAPYSLDGLSPVGSSRTPSLAADTFPSSHRVRASL